MCVSTIVIVAVERKHFVVIVIVIIGGWGCALKLVVSCCEGVVWSKDSGKRQIFGVISGPVWLDESEEKQDDDGAFSLVAIEHDDELEWEWTSVLQCLDQTEELKRDRRRGI